MIKTQNNNKFNSTIKLQVPTTFVGLEKWIQELWQQKEAQLQKFSETQEFMPLTLEQRLPRTSTTLQVVTMDIIFYWSVSSSITRGSDWLKTRDRVIFILASC